MRKSMGAAVLAIGGVLVLAIGQHEPTEARQIGLGGGGFNPPLSFDGDPEPLVVHVRVPASGKELEVMRLLEEPIPMSFANGKTLGEVLDYIKEETAKIGPEGGLKFHVDDIGLQEAEVTLESPVRIDLEGIPLRTTLKLVLDQLDLAYQIQPEGFVIITAKGSEDTMLRILDELISLRIEVRALKEGETKPE